MSEDLPPIAGGAGAPRASRPSQTMVQTLFECLAADAVLNHAGRKNHAVSKSGCTVADNKILGKIMAECIEATDRLDDFSTRRESRAESKIHLPHQPRHQHTGQKFRVHADGFKLRPKASSGDGAIRTCDHAHRRVLELGGHALQQIRRNAHVAIAHDENAMFRPRQQMRQTVSLPIRHRWVASLNEMDARTLWKLAAYFV